MNIAYKKSIYILFVLLFIFSLSSCMKTVNDNYEEQADIADVDFKAIYKYFLSQKYDELSSNDELHENAKFGLFYIDSDSVPELVIANGSYHGVSPELYTIVDNQVEYVGEYGSFGTFQFGENSGLIISNHFVNGGLDIYCIYSFENGAATYLWGGGKKSFPANDEDDERPSQYFIYETDPYDDDELDIQYQTSKETYEKNLNYYQEQVSTDIAESTAMFEMTLDNINYYSEKFGSKEFDDKVYSDAKDRKLHLFSYSLKYEYPYYYFCDLNADGYEDIIYYFSLGDPCVGIYKNGEYHITVLESEVKLGSLFPSGAYSGLYFDKDKGVIIYVYSGHTTGTLLDHGAEAFEISGISVKSKWVILSDTDYYYTEYSDKSDYEKACEECLADFREKYNYKTEGLNLVDFFDVCNVYE